MTKHELEKVLLEDVDAKRLMAHAEYITAEDRESGSPGEKRAAEYFREVMTKLGLQTDIHYVENYISLPVSGSLELEDGTKLSSCITHSYGASTAKEGLTGEVVFFDGTQDVRGKIAVMHGLASAVPCKNLEGRGAIGIICITSGDYPFNMSISPIWGQPVPDTVDMISKIPVVTVNTPDGTKLLGYLEQGKKQVTMWAEVSTKFRTVPICVAELKATNPTDRFVMFGGHVDSWHKGGADNGGANAVVLELAEVFSKYKDHLNTNVRFVWWSGHSNGRYSGSNWYADYHWEDIHDNAVVNFDIDTVGAKGSTNFHHIECNKQCYSVGKQVVSEFTGQVPEYMRIQRNGDQSFWAHGVPTLFECLSLQPVEGAGQGTFMPGLPWYWHTICDTFEHLGEEELCRDAKIFASAIWRFISANAYPFHFSDLAGEMKEDLEKYQKLAGESFDLSGVAAQVEKLGDGFELLDAEIGRLNDLEEPNEAEQKRMREINDLSMDLNRILIPVHYCKNGDLFQVDLAIPIPSFPEFSEVGRLAAMDSDTNEFKFLERQLHRERNRVQHFLKQAQKRLDAVTL
jgi:hypothetical protein